VLAGLLVISVLSGSLTAGIALAMPLPFWVVALSYSVGGMLGIAFGVGAAATVMPRLSGAGPQDVPHRSRV
jgi:hypothetical protein